VVDFVRSPACKIRFDVGKYGLLDLRPKRYLQMCRNDCEVVGGRCSSDFVV
jgi:hypothetical protein